MSKTKHSNNIILSDLDGTLTSSDALEYLVECNGNAQKYTELNKLARKEKIKGIEILNQRIQLLQGMSTTKIPSYLSKKNLLRSGFQNFEKFIVSRNINLIIISGNIKPVVEYYGRMLSASHCIYTDIEEDENGSILGMTRMNKQVDILRSFFTEKGLALEDAIMIGNDEYDVPFFNLVKHSIAFNSNEEISFYTNASLTGDLDSLVKYLQEKAQL